MNKNKIALLLGCVCVVLTFAICIQLKTIELANKTVASSFTENKLRDEVFKWKGRYDDIYENLQIKEEELEDLRKKATENNDISASVREELKLANRMLGLAEVTGKGVIITLEDNKLQNVDGITTGNIADYVVHDDDLIRIVNDMKNAGAEAISINEQRIVSQTGIVCDGNVVRINGEKVSTPFVIKAIGYPESIIGALTFLGGYLENLEAVGVVKDISKSNSITIPKYEGIISMKYITASE